MSIAYEPVNGTKALQAFANAGIVKDDGKPFDASTYRETLGKLLDYGLLENNQHLQPRCNPNIAEVATRDAVRDGRFEAMIGAVRRILPNAGKEAPFYYFRSFLQAVREFRLHFYQGNTDRAFSILDRIYEQHRYETLDHDPMQAIADAPFDEEWLANVPIAVADPVLWSKLSSSAHSLTLAEEAYDFLSKHWNTYDTGGEPPTLLLLLAEQALWRGRLRELESVLSNSTFVGAKYYLAAQALFDGNNDEALRLFDEGNAMSRSITRKRNPEIPGPLGLFYGLTLIKTGDRKHIRSAQQFLRRRYKSSGSIAAYALVELTEDSLGNPPPSRHEETVDYFVFGGDTPLEAILLLLVSCWRGNDLADRWGDAMRRQFDRAVGGGYRWLAAETASALALANLENADHAQFAESFYEETGMRPLSALLEKQEAWERGLEALANVAEGEKSDAPDAEVRLAWRIDFSGDYCAVEAREVKKRANGAWTKGKVVSAKRLNTQPEQFNYLTPQDREACNHISVEVERYGYYTPKTRYFFTPRVVLALVGHPLVFRNNGNRLEVTRGEPELRVMRKGKRVVIHLAPSISDEADVCVVPETVARIKVVEFTPAHRRIATILGQGLEVPIEHESRVLDTLSSVASLITIHSDIGGGMENVPEVPADGRPRVILVPSGEGLRVQLMVQPLTGGAYYRPGGGGETVMAEVEGQRVQTRRNLKSETGNVEDILAKCSTLRRSQEIDGEWYLDDPGDCLELLTELRELGDTAVVEWPQGEKMRVAQTASFANLRFRLKGQREWFEASGSLQLDDGRVMDIRKLLDLLDEGTGRFVPMGDGEYLALTKEFRKRLDEFSAVSESRGEGYRIHPLAAPTLEGLIEGVGEFKADAAWKNHIKRFREAETIEAIVPTTFRATLRDYQLEGFQWLTRLDHWGAGACLADDMGLGKTVQALAFILSKGTEGPALVIAPTSVCMNWMEEARRFAPSLNPILFGPGDRQATLDALEPMDMLVCSYGLLYQEEDKLGARQWRVAVLDEAQAIKNVATRRSKAAMNLQADFRLITTGTPIENHLGELWNLFCFINRGLLGSLERFTQQFANPIERRQDREARNQLKRIVQPFMLRRVKEEVLEELPARTEILLHVEFSDEEAAYYEALRQQAVDKLANAKGNAGQKHLQILAEIMRLRRACCNSKLVSPEMAVPSTKLSVFMELVDELVENRHKALVFSQFVDHLSILREALDKREIAYQYLDGSTRQRERKRRVDAFQSGEGDLFLISLKAGGTGLNLTAADYVIHMDPWWNPAVEDQASDRAHRIGQKRPVTIYRLVTKDTIESKIVELHNKKRDLADSLLEGAEMTGKMSADELLALLQESL